MITLLGHGYIGQEIANELKLQNIKFNWFHHDENWEAKEATVIINAAGYTGTPNVDACENHREECIKGNILWPLEIQQVFREYSVTYDTDLKPIIHIASGCLYEGGPFTETDKPNFIKSFYSLCKKIAEEEITKNPNSYVLRIRMPFGRYDHPKNLLSKLRNYSRLVDVENSLSYVQDVAKVAIHFALNLPTPGIYNVVNSGSITTRQIIDIMGLEKDWFDSYEEFLSTIKTPRSNCVLDNSKLKNIYPIQSVEDALKLCVIK